MFVLYSISDNEINYLYFLFVSILILIVLPSVVELKLKKN